MADSFTPTLNLRKPEVNAADDTWGGPTGLNGDLDLLDAVFLSTGLGTAVGLHVGSRTLAGGSTPTDFKLLVDGGGTVDALADNVTLRDKTDPTKVVKVLADLVTTGTTRTLHIPDVDGTIAIAERVMPTGTKLDGYWGATPPPGFVFADGRTIGNAASGATNRANADTVNLFTRFWSFNDNTRFPLQNSDGTPATRGASAAIDYGLNKRITLPDHSGAVTAGRDNLSGTSRNRLNTALGTGNVIWGFFGGEQAHVLSVAELAGHGHTFTNQGSHFHGFPGGGSPITANNGQTNYLDFTFNAAPTSHTYAIGTTDAATISGGTDAAGSNVGHNTVQPTVVCDVVIAL